MRGILHVTLLVEKFKKLQIISLTYQAAITHEVTRSRRSRKPVEDPRLFKFLSVVFVPAGPLPHLSVFKAEDGLPFPQ